jgi:uncharacterized membrane protein YidH (DUF202 family)
VPRTPVHTAAGLAEQRTMLAWTRTLAGMLAAGVLAARAGFAGWPPVLATLVLAVVAVPVLAALSVAGYRRRVLRRAGPPALRAVRAWALAAAVVAIACAGIAAAR